MPEFPLVVQSSFTKQRASINLVGWLPLRVLRAHERVFLASMHISRLTVTSGYMEKYQPFCSNAVLRSITKI